VKMRLQLHSRDTSSMDIVNTIYQMYDAFVLPSCPPYV